MSACCATLTRCYAAQANRILRLSPAQVWGMPIGARIAQASWHLIKLLQAIRRKPRKPVLSWTALTPALWQRNYAAMRFLGKIRVRYRQRRKSLLDIVPTDSKRHCEPFRAKQSIFIFVFTVDCRVGLKASSQ